MLDPIGDLLRFLGIDLPSLSSETPMTVESDSSNGADKPKRSRQLWPLPISRASPSMLISLTDWGSQTATAVDKLMDLAGIRRRSPGTDNLAELSLIDPKRAKRILANRQSAARSKERKCRLFGQKQQTSLRRSQ